LKSIRERRNVTHGDVDSEGSWAVSYADMVTLLLGFFILFFTVDVDQERAETLMNSLKMTLNSLDQRAPAAFAAPLAHVSTGSSPLPVPDVEFEIEGVDMNLVDFNEKLIVDFVGVSFFRSGEIKLTPAGEEVLKAFTRKYMPYAGQYMLQIQAFTDNKPVKQLKGRKFSDNLELSALRSVAAMRVLQRAGIPLQRMRISGLGELVLSEEYLRKAHEQSAQGNELDLARKIIIVIQPEPRKREAADVG
jgi:chemotaxis protein MotB